MSDFSATVARRARALPRTESDVVLRDATLQTGVLYQAGLCIIPAMVLVAANNPSSGARWLFATLTVLTIANLLFSTPHRAIALVVATLPATMLLRGLFLYNSILLFLAVPVAITTALTTHRSRILFRTAFPYLLIFAFVYWLSSFALTGEYYRNLRALELVFSVGAILLLVQAPTFLATALFGLIIAVVSVGLAMIGGGDRLGMSLVSDTSLGNPISYGIPVALLLLLVMGDRAKWLMLQRLRLLRTALCVPLLLLLLLSTSRASWLVGVVGITTIIIFNKYDRFWMGLSLSVLTVATAILLQTNRGAPVAQWLDRTISSERTLSQKTSGRSEQWRLFPRVAADAMPYGFGPGSGAEMFAKYSADDPTFHFRSGKRLMWHSLYQQLTIELGVFGVVSMLFLFTHLVAQNRQRWKMRGEVIPLVGTLSFTLIAATVSGLDALSGLFLGFGMVPITTDVTEGS